MRHINTTCNEWREYIEFRVIEECCDAEECCDMKQINNGHTLVLCSGFWIHEIHVQVKSSKRFSVGRNSFSIEVDIAHEYVVMMRHMLSSASKEDLRNRPYRLGKQSIPFKLTSLMSSLMYKVICHSPGASLFDWRWFINQHLTELCQQSWSPSISFSSSLQEFTGWS